MSDMSEWRTILGKAVRERRQAFELTLDEASRVIGISRSHLNLIELGKATGISRECAERIDANLDFNGELLALLALAATVLLDPDHLNAPSTIDAALLHDLESLTVDLAHRHHYVRPHTIIGPIRAHLRYLLCLEI